MAGSDPEKMMAKADKMTKLSFTRWSTDWKNATLLYEQAANGFRVAKNYEKAKLAFEKASKGQEMLSSPWDAAKHMESAAALAKDLNIWSEVADFYRKASELYIECGRSQPASDALAKGARALEDSMPDEAIRLYTDACVILEEDGKEQMAFDLYRAATSVFIKLEKYEDAATFLLRLGLAADKCNARNSQCKAYLGAVIVYLYAHDFKQAEQCFNDCSQTDAFIGSDQFHSATKLLSAYRDGDAEEIKHVAQSSTISHLDHMGRPSLEFNMTGKTTIKDLEDQLHQHMTIVDNKLDEAVTSMKQMVLEVLQKFDQTRGETVTSASPGNGTQPANPLMVNVSSSIPATEGHQACKETANR